MKALTVFAFLLMSLSSFAANVDVLKLKAGDKLIGVDIVKNDVCSIIVMGDQLVNGKLELTLEVKVGSAQSKDFKVKEKGSLLNKLLMKEVSKARNEESGALEVVESFLRTNKSSKKSNFIVRHTNYFEHVYNSRSLIECSDLALEN